MTRGPQVTLTVWAVGFANGSCAEVRSSLARLRRRLRPHLRHVRIRIIGFKLNANALQRARSRGQAPHIVVLTPSLATWSRLPAAGAKGPRAVRSRVWPWGLPWLSPAWRKRCDSDNARMRCLLKFFHFIALRNQQPAVAYADTEDVGDAMVSTASSWQLPELTLIAREAGLQRYACFQCQLGRSVRARPTAFLTNFRPPSEYIIGPSQWPPYIHIESKVHYRGPLRLPCGCGVLHRRLTRCHSQERFVHSRLLTKATMDTLLAGALNRALVDILDYGELLREGPYRVAIIDDINITDAEDAAPRAGGGRVLNNKRKR